MTERSTPVGTEPTIRRWSHRDARPIGALWFDAYMRAPERGGDLMPNARSSLVDWIRDRERDRSSFGYVAESGDVLVGFLLGRIGVWDFEPPILRPRKLARIDAVFVVESVRRLGVATALVETALEHARTAGAAGVEAMFETDYAAAEGLWRKLGFVPGVSRAYRSLRP